MTLLDLQDDELAEIYNHFKREKEALEEKFTALAKCRENKILTQDELFTLTQGEFHKFNLYSRIVSSCELNIIYKENLK